MNARKLAYIINYLFVDIRHLHWLTFILQGYGECSRNRLTITTDKKVLGRPSGDPGEVSLFLGLSFIVVRVLIRIVLVFASEALLTCWTACRLWCVCKARQAL